MVRWFWLNEDTTHFKKIGYTIRRTPSTEYNSQSWHKYFADWTYIMPQESSPTATVFTCITALDRLGKRGADGNKTVAERGSERKSVRD